MLDFISIDIVLQKKKKMPKSSEMQDPHVVNSPEILYNLCFTTCASSKVAHLVIK